MAVGSDGAPARSGPVGHGYARYELQGVVRKLSGGRNEHEKAPEVVGHGWLQLRRGSVMAAVVETAGGPHLRSI